MASRKRAALIAALGAVFLVFGLLWITCWLVSAQRFPVDGFGGWNAVAAVALIGTGTALLVQARVVGRR